MPRPTSRRRAALLQGHRPASGSPRCSGSSVTGRGCGRSSGSGVRRRSRSPTCSLPRSRRRWVARARLPAARARRLLRGGEASSGGGATEVTGDGGRRGRPAVGLAVRSVRSAGRAGRRGQRLGPDAARPGGSAAQGPRGRAGGRARARSLHRRSFPSIRRPVVPALPALDADAEAEVRQRCLEANCTGSGGRHVVARGGQGCLAAACRGAAPRQPRPPSRCIATGRHSPMPPGCCSAPMTRRRSSLSSTRHCASAVPTSRASTPAPMPRRSARM